MPNERECPNCTTEDWDENGCLHCNAPYVGHDTPIAQTNDHHADLMEHLDSKGTPEEWATAIEEAEDREQG